MQQAWADAKERSPHFGPQRLRLPGPLGAATHLEGALPGDQGFDPFALWKRASDRQRLWLQEAELLHARWAMLGLVGALLPEALVLRGVDNIGESVWWKVRTCRKACACRNRLPPAGSSVAWHARRLAVEMRWAALRSLALGAPNKQYRCQRLVHALHTER